MNTTFIEYKDHSILVMDFAGVETAEDGLRRIAEAKLVVAAQPPGSIRVLTKYRDSVFNREVTQALRELAKHNEPFIHAAALVGITGMQKIVLTAVSQFTGRTFKTFDNEPDALDWLITQ